MQRPQEALQASLDLKFSSESSRDCNLGLLCKKSSTSAKYAVPDQERYEKVMGPFSLINKQTKLSSELKDKVLSKNSLSLHCYCQF